MQIIGHGMIARSFLEHQHQFPDYVIFASGVSNSSEINPAEFDREYDLLYETLHNCINDGKCIVYFSSGGVIYGKFEKTRTEKSPVFPISSYGRHKLLCESVIKQSGVDYLILRLPQLVGAHQNTNQLVASLIQQACLGQATVHRLATRDLLDVDDMVHVLMQLLDLNIRNETFIMASGYSIEVSKIFEEIQHILGTDAVITMLEQGDRQAYDIEKLKQCIPNELPFTLDYYKTIIQKYAHQLAETIVRGK